MNVLDRAHVDDVEKEIDVYAKHMEDYINALKLEIKNRITLISVLRQAETQLEADRKDVKLVANVSNSRYYSFLNILTTDLHFRLIKCLVPE